MKGFDAQMNISIEKNFDDIDFLNKNKNLENKIDYNNIINEILEESLSYLNCPYQCEINVLVTSNKEISLINKEQRGIDKPTDVLSFPFIDFVNVADFSKVEENYSFNFNSETNDLVLGDIVISLEKALEQSQLYNHSLEREIAFLTAHSVLHLCGYDHIEENDRIEMEKIQDIILNKKGYIR